MKGRLFCFLLKVILLFCCGAKGFFLSTQDISHSAQEKPQKPSLPYTMNQKSDDPLITRSTHSVPEPVAESNENERIINPPSPEPVVPSDEAIIIPPIPIDPFLNITYESPPPEPVAKSNEARIPIKPSKNITNESPPQKNKFPVARIFGISGIVFGVACLMVVAWVLAFRFCCTGGQAQADVHSLNEIVSHPCHYRDENVPSSSIQNNVEAATNMMAVSIQVLRQATNNFSDSNILGKGGFGIVYKGQLEDGTTIAVKRMQDKMVGEKGLNEFKSEMKVLSTVRHKHLVALRGYCLEDSEKILVLEYLPQGTLSQHLFDRKDDGLKALEWKTRLSIALDVARGVEYLHGFAQQSFIHRDLKPSNILLGDDMCAKVADFGLVRLVPEGKASIHTKFAGTFGYIAPEYAATGRTTTKLDVYSYGVILMGMITGKRALDDSQQDNVINIVEWFIKQSFENVIDPAMKIDEEGLESFRTIAELARHCCEKEPNKRPDMRYVVQVLAPLVEIWKPAEPDADDMHVMDLPMSLPEAMSKWQNLEGMSSILEDTIQEN